MKFPRWLGDEDELDREPATAPQVASDEPLPAPVPRTWLAGFVLLAAAVRLGYLFFFNVPENAGGSATDAYHHWQIAYLTNQVGLSHGFRLWDMRGWEYVWGPLHPILMNLLFFATGSVDIVLARLLSLAFGLASVALIFALCHRYWGLGVAAAATAFAALSPVSVFNDVAGMAEPIAVALILFGVWLAPRRGFWAGAAWAAAAMARVEVWLLGPGMVLAWLVARRGTRLPRAPLVLGWALGMAAYCGWLLAETGNPIYPFWVGFQFAGLGAGGVKASSDPVLWAIFSGAALLALAGAAWAAWKRPAPYLVLCYGFGYSALSLATYLRYASEWKERRFEFPLDFAAILLALFFIRWVPTHWPRFRWAAIAVAGMQVVLAQAIWIPVQNAYAATSGGYEYDVALAHSVGEVYNRPENRGAVLNMPGDQPVLLYFLVRDEGLRGDRVTSQFYDPFYYLPAGYTYADHPQAAGALMQCWLSKTKTRLMLISPPGPLSATNDDYRAFIAGHPDWFQDAGASLPTGWSLYTVSVPAPSSPSRR